MTKKQFPEILAEIATATHVFELRRIGFAARRRETNAYEPIFVANPGGRDAVVTLLQLALDQQQQIQALQPINITGYVRVLSVKMAGDTDSVDMFRHRIRKSDLIRYKQVDMRVPADAWKPVPAVFVGKPASGLDTSLELLTRAKKAKAGRV